MSAKKSTFAVITALSLTLLMSASTSYAHPKKSGPPQIAIDACASLAENDSCSFTGRHGNTLDGTCIVPKKKQDVLACKPEGRKHAKKRKSGDKNAS